MKRREFLMAASGVAGGTAAGAAPAGAQETTTSDGNTTSASGNETTTAANETAEGNESDAGGGGGGGGGPTEEVTVGPGNSLVFEPAELTIAPGTTVRWVWDSDNHNVVPSSQPDGSDWSGTEGGDSETYNSGHEYEFTFETEGDYEYYCTPHETAGMVGSITVQEGGASEGGGGAAAEEDPEHMGVAFQAHFVGLATILMVVVSLVYTFFTVKYGESPHAKGGN